jgi:hypothetical protein
MDRFPSLNEMTLMFLGVLRTLGLWNSIIILGIFGYCFVYSTSLVIIAKRAAIVDVRTLGAWREKNYSYGILRKRIARLEPFTLIYILFIPAGPILVLMMALLTFGRQIK